MKNKAAFLIKGTIIHSIFNIPVSNSRKKIEKESEFIELRGEKLKILQETFKKISHIIIDE